MTYTITFITISNLISVHTVPTPPKLFVTLVW